MTRVGKCQCYTTSARARASCRVVRPPLLLSKPKPSGPRIERSERRAPRGAMAVSGVVGGPAAHVSSGAGAFVNRASGLHDRRVLDRHCTTSQTEPPEIRRRTGTLRLHLSLDWQSPERAVHVGVEWAYQSPSAPLRCCERLAARTARRGVATRCGGRALLCRSSAWGRARIDAGPAGPTHPCARRE